MSPGGKCDASRLFFRLSLCPSERDELNGRRNGMFIIGYWDNLFAKKVNKKGAGESRHPTN